MWMIYLFSTNLVFVCLCCLCVVSLLFFVAITLFQRKRRSPLKRTAKSVKTKAKPYKFLSAKQSAAKKLAANKKKRHGYQATAPVKAAYLGVKYKCLYSSDPVRIHRDVSSVTKGRSLMLVWMLPNSPCPPPYFYSLLSPPVLGSTQEVA